MLFSVKVDINNVIIAKTCTLKFKKIMSSTPVQLYTPSHPTSILKFLDPLSTNVGQNACMLHSDTSTVLGDLSMWVKFFRQSYDVYFWFSKHKPIQYWLSVKSSTYLSFYKYSTWKNLLSLTTIEHAALI